MQFKSAGLHPVMLENVEHCGYEFATPIQAYAIPAVITGHDMIGVAQTGKSVIFETLHTVVNLL